MLWLLLACYVPDVEVDLGADPDGDGYGPEVDCGPLDAAVNPGAEEVWYDGVDQDCSETSDYDQDGDGFASAVAPDERGLYGTDCDDRDAATSPGSEEECDERDNDCDGETDEGAALEACRWRGELSLTEADIKFEGDTFQAFAGSAVSGVGDLDGDGQGDLLVGAYHQSGGDSFAGAGYLFFSSGALAEGEAILRVDSADLILVGEREFGFAGATGASAGDIDGDGYADLWVGASGDDAMGDGAGAAYLVLSSSLLEYHGDTFNLSAADLKFVGEGAGDYLGSAQSITVPEGIGDDIFLLVGAPLQEVDGYGAGAVYFILDSNALAAGESILGIGEADVKLEGTGGVQMGIAVSGGGDVDGDGQADVLVGSWGRGAYLLLSDSLTDARGTTIGTENIDLWLKPGTNGNLAGVAVSILGDVDGDGRADVAVGDPYYHTSEDRLGMAYLLLSSGTLNTLPASISLDTGDFKWLGEYDNDEAGFAVSSAGDVDGDGRIDLLVGTPQDYESSDAGAAYLLLSSGSLSKGGTTRSLSEADLRLSGEAGGDAAGIAISTAGDVNGDGFDDLVIGAPFNDAGGEDAGAAYLLFGRSF
jgi:hypothetical protein